MTDKEKIIIDGVNVKDCRRRIGKERRTIADILSDCAPIIILIVFGNN